MTYTHTRLQQTFISIACSQEIENRERCCVSWTHVVTLGSVDSSNGGWCKTSISTLCGSAMNEKLRHHQLQTFCTKLVEAALAAEFVGKWCKQLDDTKAVPPGIPDCMDILRFARDSASDSDGTEALLPGDHVAFALVAGCIEVRSHGLPTTRQRRTTWNWLRNPTTEGGRERRGTGCATRPQKAEENDVELVARSNHTRRKRTTWNWLRDVWKTNFCVDTDCTQDNMWRVEPRSPMLSLQGQKPNATRGLSRDDS